MRGRHFSFLRWGIAQLEEMTFPLGDEIKNLTSSPRFFNITKKMKMSKFQQLNFIYELVAFLVLKKYVGE